MLNLLAQIDNWRYTPSTMTLVSTLVACHRVETYLAMTSWLSSTTGSPISWQWDYWWALAMIGYVGFVYRLCCSFPVYVCWLGYHLCMTVVWTSLLWINVCNHVLPSIPGSKLSAGSPTEHSNPVSHPSSPVEYPRAWAQPSIPVQPMNPSFHRGPSWNANLK